MGSPSTLPGQRFACTMCGRCCRDVWSVEVDVVSRRAIEAAGRQEGLERHGATWRTRVRDGGCTFLEPTGLCGVHGIGKPSGCSRFPFLVVRTPDGVVVGASFYCPAVVDDEGPPMAESVPAILSAPRVGFLPLDAGRGRSLSWEQYREWEARLADDVEAPDPALALFHRLQDFAAWLVRKPPAGAVRDPGLTALRTYVLAALVGSVEAGMPQGAPELTKALLDRDRVRLERFGWEGDPARLLSVLDAPAPPWLDAQIRRYLRALLFRKFPAADRPVVSNLVLLALLPWLGLCYTRAAADRRGSPEPAFEDWKAAVEWLELRLVTHVSGMEPLLSSLAEMVIRQVEARVAPRAGRSRVAAAAFALALALGGLAGWQAVARPPLTVALVVEEPAGQGVDPGTLRALREAGGHATFLLDLAHLQDVGAIRELEREGNDVGACEVPERQLEAVRHELERARVRLDVVHPGDPAEAPDLERHGFRVVLPEGRPPGEVSGSLRDGEILVIRPNGGDLPRLIRKLHAQGVRMVRLSELSG